MWRRFQGPLYTDHESLRATTLGAQLDAEWKGIDRLRVGARLGALGFLGRFSSSAGPHLAITALAIASYGF